MQAGSLPWAGQRNLYACHVQAFWEHKAAVKTAAEERLRMSLYKSPGKVPSYRWEGPPRLPHSMCSLRQAFLRQRSACGCGENAGLATCGFRSEGSLKVW